MAKASRSFIGLHKVPACFLLYGARVMSSVFVIANYLVVYCTFEPSNVPAGSVFGGTTFRQPVFGSAQPAPTTPVLGNSGEVFGSRQTDTFGAGLEKGNFNLKSSQETQGKGVFGFNISTASTEIPRSTFTQASSVQRLFGTSQDDAGVGVFSGNAPGNFSATFTPISTTSSVFGASSSKGRSFSFGQPKEIKQAAPFGFPITPTIESSKEHNVFGAATVSRGPSVFGANPFGKSNPPLKRTSPHNKSGNQQTSPTTDISALKGLVIREIPEAFNKNPWLKRFYSRFGEVAKIICYPRKKSASVIFKTHAAAEQAKRKGTVLLPGTAPVSIFWKQDKKRSRTGRTSAVCFSVIAVNRVLTTLEILDKYDFTRADNTNCIDLLYAKIFTSASKGNREFKNYKLDQSNVASEEGKQMVTKGLMVVGNIYIREKFQMNCSGGMHLITSHQVFYLFVPPSGGAKRVLRNLSSLPTALSAGDRFRILDMIDKKIRQGVKKATDISTAKAVKGACPDMCPEKERYMREDRRRLHVFETVPGSYSMEENPKVNHSKAIKEYDRSAADKGYITSPSHQQSMVWVDIQNVPIIACPFFRTSPCRMSSALSQCSR
ncbi:predicted protein [Nematostella vectensis]|uniref:Uncharacterized protein n=1 Tax=Nematostella vectensis TaxID=45351 RepID=A7T6T6_NEMVE|nr:predicted protein [Nematostella vectensis]|eukprot:XP_001620418.1 hypothetical protein NEMVEDRAFT_v1g223141 [Nematostella vectensis]